MPTVSENEKKTLGNTTLKVQQNTGIIEQKKTSQLTSSSRPLPVSTRSISSPSRRK